jgi:cyclopropane-fatty-acyl-phospholipid synthase
MSFLESLTAGINADGIAIVDWKGRTFRIGSSEPRFVLRLADRRLSNALALNPRIAFGEAYMDGRLTIEGGSLYDFLAALCQVDMATGPVGRLVGRLAPAARWLQQYNPIKRSRDNVAHHYDLKRHFFELFLDRDMQYSCAYFGAPDIGLEEAQEAKKRHLASKLLLQPGMKVLDIGCGWGGLGLYLAKNYGVEVTGVTLSVEQLAVARERVAAAGLDRQVHFEGRDYRTLTGPFDRIVSVGMFEHVGLPQYDRFFAKVGELLAPDGVAVIHSIGRSDGPGLTDPWIRKYIFPGGYSPALSEVLPPVERSQLWVTDIEILRLHYAETLRHWRRRFEANLAEIRRIYDERFCRMWELFLVGSEIAFRYQGHMVFQIQLARQQAAVPLTRDYMFDAERALPEQRTAAAH